MVQSLNQMQKLGSSTPQEDLGPLAWVLDEVKASVEVANRALKQFASDASVATGTDLASLDDTQLRLAGQQLHQAMGALTMVGLEKPSRVLLQMNKVIQRFLSKPELCTTDAATVLDRAGYALTFYLESYLSGRKMSAIALFPQYADVSVLADDKLTHPSQLWEHEWKWLDIDMADGDASQASPIDAQTRAPMDKWVLKVVRGMDTAAAEELRQVALAISRSPLPRQTIVFWRLAAGYFDAIAQELLADNRYTKRAASQVLMQFVKQMKAPDNASPDLAHELLFHCAQSPTPDAGSALGKVRVAYGLEKHIPLDYETVHFGQVDPTTVARTRKYLATVKETWSLVSGGELNRLDQISAQFSKLCNLLIELLPNGQGLASALQQCADGVVAARRPPDTTQALEVATAILYVEAVLEDFDLNDPTLPERSRRLCERIEAARTGSPAEPLESWMEELYRRVSDRQNMGSVVGELKATLAEVEKHMDEYFRNPEDKSSLQDVPHGMSQMRGVLSVLGLDDATQTVLQMREVVENIMVGDASAQALRSEGIFERLGNNLGALGFLIDMLSYQPALAKKLFVFDSIHGELRPLMGVQKDSDGEEEEKVGFMPSTVIVGGADWNDASTLIPEEEGQEQPPVTATDPSEPLIESDSLLSFAEEAAGEGVEITAPHLETQKIRVDAESQSQGVMDTVKLNVADIVPAAADLSLDASDDTPAQAASAAVTVTDTPVTDAVQSQEVQVAAAAGSASAVVEDDDFDEEIFEIFLDEARETITQAQETIGALRKNPANITDLTNLRRSYHTLKGSGRMVDLTEYSEAAWAMEQLFNSWLAESRSATDELLDLAEQSMGGLGEWIEAIDSRTDGHYTAQPYAVSADAMRLEKRFVPLVLDAGGEQPTDTVDADVGQAVGQEQKQQKESQEAEAASEAISSTDAVGDVDSLAVTVGEDAVPDAAVESVAEEQAAESDADLEFDALFSDRAESVEPVQTEQAEVAAEADVPAAAVDSGGTDGSLPLMADEGSLELSVSEAGETTAEAITVEDEETFAQVSDFDLNLLDAQAETQTDDVADDAVSGVQNPEAEQTGGAYGLAAAAGLAVAAGAADMVSDTPDLSPAEDSGQDAEMPTPFEVSVDDTLEAEEPAVVEGVDWQESDSAAELPAAQGIFEEELTDMPVLQEVTVTEAVAATADKGVAAEAVAEEEAVAAEIAIDDLPAQQSADGDEYRVIGPLRISIPLFNVYLAEADEWSRKLVTSLCEWAMEDHRLVPEDAVSYAHSLAGSSGTIGFLSLSGLARQLEHVMERDLHAGSVEFSHKHSECFIAAAKAVRSMLQGFAAGELADPEQGILDALNAAMEDEPPAQETTMAGLAVLDDSVERLRQAEASRQEDWESRVDLDAPVADSGYFAGSLQREAVAQQGSGHTAAAVAPLTPTIEPAEELETAEEPALELPAENADAAADIPVAAEQGAAEPLGVAGELSEGAVTADALEADTVETEMEEVESEQTAAAGVTAPEVADTTEGDAIESIGETQPEDILTDIWSEEEEQEITATDAPADAGTADVGAATTGAAFVAAGASAAVLQSLPEREEAQADTEEAAAEKKSVLISATDAQGVHAHGDENTFDVEDVLDEDLFPIFEEEAQELIPQLSSGLRDWSSNVENQEARSQVLRVLHTLKGSARLAGALRMGEMAHNLESTIESIGSEGVDASQVEPLLEECDSIVSEFERLRNLDQAEQAAIEARIENTETDAGVAVTTPGGAVDVVVSSGGTPDLAVTDTDTASTAAVVSAQPVVGTGSVPVRKPQAVKAKSGGQIVRVRSQLLDRILNQTGEVMITRSRLEGGLGQLRSSVADLSNNLERLRAQLRDVEVQAETQMQSRMAQNQESMQTFDPLEFDRFTRMQELTRMMAESVNDVATVQRAIQKTVDATEADLMAQARQTRELQRDLLRTRMVEFDSVSERLYRVVRQSAKETGKSVRLDLFGGRIEMDRGVLDRMTPVFEHLLRNAVAHGIETGDQRLNAGKDEVGTISVAVSQDGNDVAIEFRDDGKGLNLEAIKLKAQAQGLIEDRSSISDQEAANLIFRSGFSTATDVTRISGRGVGMDVVRSEVNALGGRIETQTVGGQGTNFKVVVPLTTAVTQVVMLKAGDTVIGVPANLLEIVRRAAPDQVTEAYEKGNFKHGQETLPFYWMGALLQSSRGSAVEDAKTMSVVVFRSAAQRLAVHVDEVLGNQEVVVKNLGPQLSAMPGLAGMSILPSGSVVLIYNPVALAAVYGETVQSYLADQARVEAKASVSVVPLVMVVDDSITVRRITQRFLQREGYRVVLAADGLQALEKLPDELPAVVLSDIEMPRMDGFDLLRNIRANKAYEKLPVVMITSRIAEKHKEHAMSLGANHYLGKPYSEEQLLALVRSYTHAEEQAATEAV